MADEVLDSEPGFAKSAIRFRVLGELSLVAGGGFRGGRAELGVEFLPELAREELVQGRERASPLPAGARRRAGRRVAGRGIVVAEVRDDPQPGATRMGWLRGLYHASPLFPPNYPCLA